MRPFLPHRGLRNGRARPLAVAAVLLGLALAGGGAAAQTPPAGPPLPDSPPATPAPASPPPPTKDSEVPAFKISGLVYGDYYAVLENHRDDLEGKNGFWLRRLYLTYDHTLSPSFSLRVRLEANSKGDFVSTGVNTPYLKDAWLKWSSGAHALTFGMAPTPAMEFVETFQGYRSLEKTPLDLYRWDGSRDFGLLVQGALGGERRTRYSVQFGNGSGNGSEVDQSKSVRGQLSHRFASGFVLEAYADWQDRPEAGDFWTLEAFLGWQKPSWRASLEFARQARRGAAPDGGDLVLDLFSAFAAVKASPRLSLVGRVDWNLDPVPNGETIDYMPFSDQAKSTFGLLGLDVTLAETVHLIPNLEVTFYDTAADGTRPGTDLVPRLTLFFNW